MVSICKLRNISAEITSICKRISSIQYTDVNKRWKNSTFTQCNNNMILPLVSHHKFHTTSRCTDLFEFFDDKKNWGENEVKHGRSWTADELRIKSNMDLHKLWFILLKERNMLLTMEHECKLQMKLFPSPERIDKVNLSMQNLETVVRERNKAYYELETGENGERPGKLIHNEFGLKKFYRASEHAIPREYNKKWKETHNFKYTGYAVNKFLRAYREKLYNEKRKSRNRDRNHVMHLLRRFPHLDKTMLATKYPSVNIRKLIADDKCRGHFSIEESVKPME